jgi:hypothetical protein
MTNRKKLMIMESFKSLQKLQDFCLGMENKNMRPYVPINDHNAKLVSVVKETLKYRRSINHYPDIHSVPFGKKVLHGIYWRDFKKEVIKGTGRPKLV